MPSLESPSDHDVCLAAFRFRGVALPALIALAAAACDPAPPQTDAGPSDAGPLEAECAFTPGPDEPIAEPEVYTARWAFEPWISKDISDRADTEEFVAGFLARDIPVGAVVFDSPWDEQYTTFVPNTERYGDFGELIAELHAQDIRVVMWVTQMVNIFSFDAEPGGDTYSGMAPNYREGCGCGFFVQDCETYQWWKGQGSGVDFFSEGARQWWHRQQDPLLDLGIDGWKLDFGESYMEADQTLMTASGPVPHQDYSEEYYRDFLAYGRMRRGRDFVTMVRAYDASYDRLGRFHARPEHAPVAWMGDNHRDWEGLTDALDHMLRSAAAGYVVLGSDIGGYLDRDQNMLAREIPFDLEVFQRWIGVGAMTPFMQLHGRANLAPWTVEERVDETVDLYRYWATLHHEMVGFWYSLTEEAYAAGEVILHPQGGETAWPGDYRFVVGEHFLVAPPLAAGDARDVALPEGARWYDWWDASADPLDGGATIAGYPIPERVQIPLFVREGAIVPLDVDSDVTGLGTAGSAGHLTVLVWPGAAESSFVLHETDDANTTITAQHDASLTVTLSRALRPVLVRARLDAAPSGLTLDGSALDAVADRAALDAADSGWFHDAASRSLWIKAPASSAAVTLVATP